MATPTGTLINLQSTGVKRQRVRPTRTEGVPGISFFGGFIDQKEKNPELRGTARYTTFDNIIANTSIVAAGVRFYLNMIAKAGWIVVPPVMDTVRRQAEADEMAEKVYIIPPKRTRYLSEIADTIRTYNQWVDAQCETAQNLFAIKKTIQTLEKSGGDSKQVIDTLQKTLANVALDLDGRNKAVLDSWETKKTRYKEPQFRFIVRDREFAIDTHHETLPARVCRPTTFLCDGRRPSCPGSARRSAPVQTGRTRTTRSASAGPWRWPC